MSHDRVTWLAAMLVCVASLTATTGCRRSPFQRLMDSPPEEPLRVVSSPSTPPIPSRDLPPRVLTASRPDSALPAATGSPNSLSVAGVPVITARQLPAVAPASTRDEAVRQSVNLDQSPTLGDVKQRPSTFVQPAAGAAPSAPSALLQPSKVSPGAVSLGPADQDSKQKADAPTDTVVKATFLTETPPISSRSSANRNVERSPASTNSPSPPQPLKAEVVKLANAAASHDRKAGGDAVEAKNLNCTNLATELGPPDPSKTSASITERAAEKPANKLDPHVMLAAFLREDREPFAVAGIRLCRKIEGFGVFQPLEPTQLRPGQSALLYSELTGLRVQSQDQSYLTRLASRVELLTRDGTRVWEQSLGEAEDISQSRRRDNYAGCRLTLPEKLNPGEYRLRLIQTDLVARQSASAELSLSILP